MTNATTRVLTANHHHDRASCRPAWPSTTLAALGALLGKPAVDVVVTMHFSGMGASSGSVPAPALSRSMKEPDRHREVTP